MNKVYSQEHKVEILEEVPEFTRGSCSGITCQEGQALDSSSEEAGLIKRTRFAIYKFHWMIELLHSAHALPAEVAHERARGGQLFAGRLKKEKDDECRLEREAERATTSKRNKKSKG